MLTSVRPAIVLTLLATSTLAPCAADDATTSSNPAPATLDGTVRITGGVLAVGVGYKWCHGTLSYQGQQVKFCVQHCRHQIEDQLGG